MHMIKKNIIFDEDLIAKIEDFLAKKPVLNRGFSSFVRAACAAKLQKEE